MGRLLTGRRANTHEMRRLGLVNEVVPVHELDTAVDRWIADLLASHLVEGDQADGAMTARFSAPDTRAQRLPTLMAALASVDRLDGVRAFQKKRKPVWSGR